MGGWSLFCCSVRSCLTCFRVPFDCFLVLCPCIFGGGSRWGLLGVFGVILGTLTSGHMGRSGCPLWVTLCHWRMSLNHVAWLLGGRSVLVVLGFCRVRLRWLEDYVGIIWRSFGHACGMVFGFLCGTYGGGAIGVNFRWC